MGSLPQVVEDCNGLLQLFSDGAVFRLKDIDFPFPPLHDQSVIYKDCLFHKPHNLHLRLYKPIHTVSRRRRRPLLFYFHAGGFCLGSRQWPNFHASCQRLSSSLDAVVVAPDYRLAPEHRLPAAMDDGYDAVKWLQSQAEKNDDGARDDWLGDKDVDFDRVFMLGDSSGGNIVHHLAVRLGKGSPGLGRVRVRGYILLSPFFGGVSRTVSEEGPAEELLSLEDMDRFWRLALPIGEDRDHEMANPFGPSNAKLKMFEMDPMLVIVGGCELLRDRLHDYATRLKKMGGKVEYVEMKGKQHGFFTNDSYSQNSHHLVHMLNRFIIHNSI